MEDFDLHDMIVVDNKRLGTIIYVYPDGSFEVEYMNNEYETVSRKRVTLV